LGNLFFIIANNIAYN